MEYKEEKLGISILVIIAALVGAGANMFLSEDQFDDAYVCTSTDKPMFCTGNEKHPAPLSGTLASCYWTDTAGNGKRTSCSGGFWMGLDKYCILHNLDEKAFMQQGTNEPAPMAVSRAKQELCPPGEPCVAKE